MLKKLTPLLTMAFLTLAVVGSCYSPGHLPDETAVFPDTKCSDIVNLQNVKQIDLASSKAYIDEACGTDGAKLLVDSEVDVLFMTTGEALALCTELTGGLADACSMHMGKKHLIMVAYGSPGALKHEMIHVMMMELNIPPEVHHDIMLSEGLYYVGGDK
jgi:hypothetical protein